MILSIIMGVLIYLKNNAIKKLKIFQRESSKGISMSKIFGNKKLILECIILFHPNPFFVCRKIYFFDNLTWSYYYYNLNDFFMLIDWIAMVYLIILLTFRTRFGNLRSARMTKIMGCTMNVKWVIKCLLKDKPFAAVFTGFFWAIPFFGWMIRVAESPLDRMKLDNGIFL